MLIERWGGDSALRGHVRIVEPSAFTRLSALGVEEQRVRIVLDITEPRSAWASLGDGFRVNARIVVSETPNAVRAPLSALFRNGDVWQTFVIRNGHAEIPARPGNGLAWNEDAVKRWQVA